MTISSRRLAADDSSGPMQAITETSPILDEVSATKSYHQLFADEKFMNEGVTIVLHPNMDASEIATPVSVNGKRVYIVPGRKTVIPRTHVAQLMKARPDYIAHRSDDYAVDESQLNRLYRSSGSRYNFEILEDTPQGISWFRDLRQRYMRQ